MTMYHISPDSGRPNICRAKDAEGCPLRDEDGNNVNHYDNKADAKKGAENSLSAKHGATTTLKKSSKIVYLAKRPDFNPETATPANFDEVLSELYTEKADAYRQQELSNGSIQRAYNQRKYNSQRGTYMFARRIDDVLEETLHDPNPDAKKKALIDDYNKKKSTYEDKVKKIDSLNNIFTKRGGWNRAFLVPDGHLHKSTYCSTCNNGEQATKFSFMTQYSGSDEKQIVSDAGYRACTTCYPSAPVGDEKSLPTKMFTPEEKEKQADKIAQENKKVAKQAAAVSKAPTLSGEPLRVQTSNLTETFKNERTALTWYSDGIKYPAHNEQSEKINKNARYSILYHIAEKRDISIKDLQDELYSKAVKTKEKDHKDTVKRFAAQPELVSDYTPPLKDDYGIPDDMLNTSPRSWASDEYRPITL